MRLLSQGAVLPPVLPGFRVCAAITHHLGPAELWALHCSSQVTHVSTRGHAFLQVLTILNQTRADYQVVNVLDDIHNPGLRETLKTYSQWPTIPQVRTTVSALSFQALALFACHYSCHTCSLAEHIV